MKHDTDETIDSFEDAAPGKFPKREKKKAETRLKIINASIELFLETSEESITFDDVAERAGVHVQTLYRHFPNKLSLMQAGDELWFEKFQEYHDRTHPEKDTFSVWKSWLRLAYQEFLASEEKYKQMYIRKGATPTGIAGLATVQVQYEDVLCKSLAIDFGMSPDGIGLPRLVAGMLMSGNAAVIRRFTEEDTDFLGETIETIELVENMFSHLITKRVRANV